METDTPARAGTVTGPAELERRRLERALEKRSRYRYVHPQVVAEGCGWRVASPCCSRNVDPQGGEIDIAWFEPAEDGWRLHARNHAQGCWVPYAQAARLMDLVDVVCTDPLRVFWP